MKQFVLGRRLQLFALPKRVPDHCLATAPIRLRVNLTSLWFLLAVWLLNANQALAANYYMATNGNDANAGTLEAPFATLSKFNSIAQPGDVLLIRGGVYYGQGVIITCSGTAGNYITFRNYEGEVPIFDGSTNSTVSNNPNCFYSDDGSFGRNDTHHIIIEGLVIRNYFRGGINFGANYSNNSQTMHDYIIRYNVVDRCGQNGITTSFADYVTIENNIVSRTGYDVNSGSWSSGINLYNMVGVNNYVRNNVSFHHVDVSENHTDGNGFILDMFNAYELRAGATLENNLFFENGGVGIAVTRTDHIAMNNNTLYENGLEPTYVNRGYGIGFFRDGQQGPFDAIALRNNIIYQSSGKALTRSTNFVNSLITKNNISGEQGSADPQFTDPANWDFTLKMSSPGINTGTATDAPTTSIGFDRRTIKSQTTDQPIAWYRLAPDIDYIISKGGLKNCFSSVSRPQGRAHDQGAYEYTGEEPPFIEVSGITVSPTLATIFVSKTTQLTATIAPVNATDRDFMWSSSDTAVATVDQFGIVRGVAVGTATITATSSSGNKVASSTITVVDGTASTPGISTPIAIDGNRESDYTGPSYEIQNVVQGTVDNSADLSGNWTSLWDNTYLYVHVNVKDDNKQNSNDETWYTDDAVEIYVDADNSKATTYGNKQFQYAFRWNANTPLEVKRNAIDGVKYTYTNIPDGYTVEVAIPWAILGVTPSSNALVGLDVQLNDADNTSNTRDGKLTWWATPDDAYRDPGLFGTTQLTGTSTSEVENVAITNVSVSPPTATVLVGNTVQLTATVSPGNATNKAVTWSSDNDAVATVSANGLITGVAVGTAVVTATSVDGNKTANTQVTVTTPTTSDGSYVIYDDALQNGWQSWGFNVITDLNSTAQVLYGNKAVSVEFTDAYGASAFNNPTPLNTSGYSAFSFWAYGASGGNTIQFVVRLKNGEIGRKQNIAIPGGQWTKVEIKLSEVGNPTEFDEIWIHDNLGRAQPVLYVDNIALDRANAGPVTCDNNLIPNPSFEEDLTGYRDISNAVITTDAHSGSKALQIGGTEAGYISQQYQNAPEQSYTLRFWGKRSSEPGYASVFVKFIDANGQDVGQMTQVDVTNTDTYQEITVGPLQAPAGTRTVLIGFPAGNGRTLYIDDLCLTGSGATVPPLVCEGNKFTNGDFEAGLTDIIVNEKLSLVSDANSGTKAVQVGNATEAGYILKGYFGAPVATYTFKVWAKRSGDGYANVELKFNDANNETISASTIKVDFPASSNYQELVLGPITAPAGTATVFVGMAAGNGAILLLDDFCLTSTAANGAPVVANAIPSQTATVGQSFSYTIPANTFSDPNNDTLTISGSGLPDGLSLNNGTISGTPSTTGVSTVSVTATDPGSLSVNATFTLTVSQPASVTTSTPFAITGVTTASCLTVSAGLRSVTFTPQYAGLTGQPVSFSVANELPATTTAGPYTLSLYTDNPVVTLVAQQNGIASRFTYNWLAACSGSVPGNQAPVVTSPIPDQVATVGQTFNYPIPVSTFSDPNNDALALSVSGLPGELSFTDGAISGTASTTGVSTVSVTATDPSNLSVSTTFTLTVVPVQPNGGALTLLEPLYNCQTGQLTFRTSGGNGSPVEFFGIGITPWTTNPVQYIDQGKRDDPSSGTVVELKARQGEKEVSLLFDFGLYCAGGQQSLRLIEPLYDCQTGQLTFQTAGGDGSSVEFFAVGVTPWTTNPVQFIDQAKRDDPNSGTIINILARQHGKEVSLDFDFGAYCNRNARRMAETNRPLNVRVLGNPVTGSSVEVNVQGIEGSTLQYAITDSQGRRLNEQAIRVAGTTQRLTVPIGRATGLYLLHVQTSTQSQTVKLIKQ